MIIVKKEVTVSPYFRSNTTTAVVHGGDSVVYKFEFVGRSSREEAAATGEQEEKAQSH